MGYGNALLSETVSMVPTCGDYFCSPTYAPTTKTATKTPSSELTSMALTVNSNRENGFPYYDGLGFFSLAGYPTYFPTRAPTTKGPNKAPSSEPTSQTFQVDSEGKDRFPDPPAFSMSMLNCLFV